MSGLVRLPALVLKVPSGGPDHVCKKSCSSFCCKCFEDLVPIGERWLAAYGARLDGQRFCLELARCGRGRRDNLRCSATWFIEIFQGSILHETNCGGLHGGAAPSYSAKRSHLIGMPKDILMRFSVVSGPAHAADGSTATCATTSAVATRITPCSMSESTAIKSARVIRIYRDLDEVVVHYCRPFSKHILLCFHGEQGSLDDFAHLYMEGSVTYGSYWDHVKDNLRFKNHHNFCLVQFEDLKRQPASEFKRISDFLQLGLNQHQIDKVVDYTSFASMKERDSKGLRRNGPKSDNGKGTFFRKGEAGDWKTKFSADLDKKMNMWIENNSDQVDIKLQYE
ncbi:unnamed protein product, partial [Meganyctiphanes norvegica]